MSVKPEQAVPSRRELANAIRALSMDAVQKAKSGHPGMPMGMADIAQVLWNDYLQHNPVNPQWFNRDRFLLSNGHGSMLLYSLLHLTGHDMPMEELRNFRQLHSKTPGHPEYGLTPAVETTTGPLGQGLANAVGMAIAEKILAACFNRPGHEVIDHYTYVFCGDGCLMEGISHEACSLAGTLSLGKLIAFYDDNDISIDGRVEGWFTDDTPRRFEAYGWHVVPHVDGHNAEAVIDAIEQARAVKDKPSLICCKTIIAYGAPHLGGTEKAHGAPLGEEEVAAARMQLGWKYEPFVIPPAVYSGWDARPRGAEAERQWNARMAAYREAHPDLARELERRIARELPMQWADRSEAFVREITTGGDSMATRKASQAVLNSFGPLLPELIGGSADLTGSNNTDWSGSRAISKDEANGNYIYFGVREFAMSAILNGLALHGGFVPYGGTFLVFSDYARNAVRLAALMGAHSIFVYTHDSIALGEDGPTHQPIEQLACLRLIPNMAVWRPSDIVETAVAWKAAIERRDGPTSLVLTRQSLPHQSRDDATAANIARGGYVLSDAAGGKPKAMIIASGSEVKLAMEAQKLLADEGVRIRVVSMPCTQVFDAQDESYRASVLPTEISVRVAVEAGVSDYWFKYVGQQGAVVGIDRFGESAPGGSVMKFFGFTAENVAQSVEKVLNAKA
ncbi:MAG: transketolase [Acidiferrobacterales bacterium]